LKLSGLDYTSPRRFTFKQRITLAIVPRAIAWGLFLISLTLRRKVLHPELWQAAMKPSGRVIIAFWHETIALAVCRYRGLGYHTLTSYSYDGELAARTIRPFGMNAVRGSTSEGGSSGLRQLALALEQIEAVGITPDGPKGPRRVAHPGAAILAARTQTPIIPHAFAVDRAWRLRSWDRFIVPKPFARIVEQYGEPISPPPDESAESIESTRQEMENALNALHQSIESQLGVSPEIAEPDR
jgi:lysophospholipid acyltransferase (LPLAT)-like uncharacterized protein